MIWLSYAVAAAGVAACGGGGQRKAVVTVSPAVALADQGRTIVVSHLRSGQVVTISARTRRPGGSWTSSATFRATPRGTVNVAHQAPISGSYTGVSAMGLLWSERRTASGSEPLNGVRVTQLAVSAANRQLAVARLTQRLSGPGVSEHSERVAQAGFFGEYFMPPGHTRRPAVVLWGGSEGGLGVNPSEASLLASHGIPALAVAYFDEPGLPCRLADIPLEYFVKAIRWLRSQPQVDPNRVWIESGSRGSEAELLVAAHWPHLVHGLVAEAPGSLVYGAVPGQCPLRRPAETAGWTLHGRAVRYDQPLSGAITYNRDGSINEVGAFKDALGLPAAKAAQIPVDRITAAVMLISGGNDQLWPSNTYADQIMSELRSDRAPHVHLNYPAAGHVVLDVPYAPPIITAPQRNIVINLGGTPAADEAAYQRDWPAMIRFITVN